MAGMDHGSIYQRVGLQELKKYNFVSEFLDQMVDELKKNGADELVWVGLHPWLHFIYAVLLEYGIKKFEVADNDRSKQGIAIYPYIDAYINSGKNGIKVKSVQEVCKNKNALYLMANTHFGEISAQLVGYGIDAAHICNLYQYTRRHIDFWDEQNRITAGYHRMSLRQVQETELEILKYLKGVCEKNNLTYFLGGGSLLGAVRHAGFIPWDDDIDVYMPYEDYLRLLDIFQSDGRYKLYDFRNEDDYILQFGQIVDSETYLLRDFGYCGCFCSMEVFVDIFPLGGWKRNLELDAKWHYYHATREMRTIIHKDCRQQINDERYALLYASSEYAGNVIRGRQIPWAVEKSVFQEAKMMRLEDEISSKDNILRNMPMRNDQREETVYSLGQDAENLLFLGSDMVAYSCGNDIYMDILKDTALCYSHLKGHSGPVQCLQVNPDGNMTVTLPMKAVCIVKDNWQQKK